MIYLMSVGCGMQFARKNGSCPGLNRWRGWGEHGGGWRFRGERGGGGMRLGVRRAEKMNNASISEVEEALLAIHVASNDSQESTDPNCSFKLQDPRGIQGLEGRFRIRILFAGSTRVRPASATTATMRASFTWAETTMTQVPPRRRAEHALVPLFVRRVHRRDSTSYSRAWQRGGITRRDCRRRERASLRLGGVTAVMGEKLLAGAGGHRHAQRRRRHIDECAYGSLV